MKKKAPVSISSEALQKVREIKAAKKIDDDYLLRIGVKPAGCGIASYVIGFDHANEKDEIFEVEDVKIIIEKIQVMHLAGKSVEYGEADGQTGFIFKDPS